MNLVTGKNLRELTNHYTGNVVKYIIKMTPMKLDESIYASLVRIDKDKEMLDKLANWLNWVPVSGVSLCQNRCVDEPELVACCEDFRIGLEKWRRWLRATL